MPLPLGLKLLLAVLVVTAGVCDVLWRRIPNWLTAPALLSGLVINVALGPGRAPGGKQAAAGAGLAFLVYFGLYLLAGKGAGDVKLMAAVGAIVGWKNWLAIFVFSSLLGGVIALALALAKNRLRQTLFNMGVILWELAHLRSPARRHEELRIESARALTLPHGAVVALGCLFFLGSGWLAGS